MPLTCLTATKRWLHRCGLSWFSEAMVVGYMMCHAASLGLSQNGSALGELLNNQRERTSHAATLINPSTRWMLVLPFRAISEQDTCFIVWGVRSQLVVQLVFLPLNRLYTFWGNTGTCRTWNQQSLGLFNGVCESQEGSAYI